ncbi:MAG: prolipoprotein diacylglyceryl transferase [Anaerolineaceae bacterium]|nr:prolipoprotein diacylglyceryl transferase [Anaerolineaceae bacterium]
MFPIINIGPFAVAATPLILFLGLLSGIFLMNSHAKKLSISTSTIENLILVSLIGGLIGARFGFVVRYWQSFTGDMLSALKLSATMFDRDFGMICALLIGLIYSQKKEIFLWQTLDHLTIVLITFMPFYYISQLASGDAYGKVSSLPWAIFVWGNFRHPIQIYLANASGIILLIYLLSTKFLKRRMFPQEGYQFLFLVTLSAFCSLILDIFYEVNKLIFKTIHVNQFYALIIILICFFIFLYRTKIKRTPKLIIFSEGEQNGN